jgi:hypothetical protein
MFFAKQEECRVCKVHEDNEKFLKETIANLIKEKADERSEYKRTVDALLVTKSLPAIGQGVNDTKGPIDFQSMLGFLDAEVEKKADI